MDQARAQDLRGLKLLVGVLGVLVLAGTAVVVGVIMQRIYARPAAASISVTPPAPGADLPAVLPTGAHIAGIALAGGLVAIWVTGESGDKVLLLNPQTGGLTVAVAAAK